MNKGRLEAFSDGVIAIIITIMVLELKVPHGAGLAALEPLLPVFASYVMSFVFVGIYWNNHHHMLHAVQHVSGPVLWANLHLLLCSLAWYVLSRLLIREHGTQSLLATAYGRDIKGKLSSALYVAAIALAFVSPWIAVALYVAVALVWLVPDRRIERRIMPD